MVVYKKGIQRFINVEVWPCLFPAQFEFTEKHMYSQLSRSCTARLSGTRFSQVGPNNLTALQSFLFTELKIK